ncbi:hypothetical protein [Actinomadura harenae]|uniref:LapA family protein n=1 Tax=Actinomadura harenae TaxID=2483351 RepID=A0A3M2LT48_9ACTN|nr:hypothetical protein [Actinomadura harenae]RMI40651.1 hypothetical protein EBO15_25605 [Actinomadura harenae]
MLFFGLILAAAVVAVAVAVVIFDTGPAHLTLFDQQVPGITSVWQVFLAGAVTAALFVVAMIMLWVGFGRMLTNRRDLRDSLTTLEMEKKELQEQLASARRGAAPAAPPRPRPHDDAGPRDNAPRKDPGTGARRPDVTVPVPAGAGPVRGRTGPTPVPPREPAATRTGGRGVPSRPGGPAGPGGPGGSGGPRIDAASPFFDRAD